MGDPWQIIAALAGIIAALTTAYAKLANDRLVSADKREERWNERDQMLMTVIEHNTVALTTMGERSQVSSEVLTAHDSRVVAVFDLAKAVNMQTIHTAEKIGHISTATDKIGSTQQEHSATLARIEQKLGNKT